MWYTVFATRERNKMKPSLKVTKTRKLFNWVIDGEEDFTLIDKNGKIIEGECHLTAAQHAKMFVDCMLEKIDKLVATKDIKAREIAEKMSDIVVKFGQGELPDRIYDKFEKINFKRENEIIHLMLIMIVRNGEEWNGEIAQ
jgi:hypothetical protein